METEGFREAEKRCEVSNAQPVDNLCSTVFVRKNRQNVQKKAFNRELQFFMNECIQISRKCRISFVRNPQNSVKVFDKWGNVKYSKLQFGNRTLTER